MSKIKETDNPLLKTHLLNLNTSETLQPEHLIMTLNKEQKISD